MAFFEWLLATQKENLPLQKKQDVLPAMQK
jgi:hypothetical protein